LSAAVARLLEAFARQAGVAAHGVRATQDLRRSRGRLVIAREEERRRLRRDLHDGLGPALAGITLGLETAAKAAARGDPYAKSLLGTLRQETAVCVEEVRRIVADLRPPALDGIGLATALRLHADRLSRATIQVSVEVADDAAENSLPAAVEVAAYRIALEAMTNAVHHSGGRSCIVTIVHRDGLRLSVIDDGCGAPGPQPGVGLASMRDRAEELGGTCTVTFREGRGTSVEAVLPMTAR
jgi:signal transduction histidine kinase